jgi:hypothetical protein
MRLKPTWREEEEADEEEEDEEEEDEEEKDNKGVFIDASLTPSRSLRT